MLAYEEHLQNNCFLHSAVAHPAHPFFQGANVLSTKTGIIKLADFGVATKLSEIDSSKRRVVGTPYWMAPETVETLGTQWFPHGGGTGVP